MGAGELGAVRADLGGPGSGFMSAAKPLGKEGETERTGSPALAVPVPYAKALGLGDTPPGRAAPGRLPEPRASTLTPPARAPKPGGKRLWRPGFPEGLWRLGGAGQGAEGMGCFSHFTD